MGVLEMPRVWDVYSKRTERVRQDHLKYHMIGTGHDFGDHTLVCAHYAGLVAPDRETAELAMAAGLCHNNDRLRQAEFARRSVSDWLASIDLSEPPPGLSVTKIDVKKMDIPVELVIDITKSQLATESFSENETSLIIDADLNHTDINRDSDSPVLVDLKDADRLTCTVPHNIMTVPHFWSELPVLDPKHLFGGPGTHPYKKPGSALDNLRCREDWVTLGSVVCVRLPKAMELMKKYVAYLNSYIEAVKAQREEIGLWPDYTFES